MEFVPNALLRVLPYWKEIAAGSVRIRWVVALIVRPRLKLAPQDNPRDAGAVIIPYYSSDGQVSNLASAIYIRVEVWNVGVKTAEGTSVMVNGVRYRGTP